jgi:ribosomal protein S18 acetylase RimI-like enzyme
MRSSTVRKASANDVPKLAALLAAAFYHDPVWGPYYLPYIGVAPARQGNGLGTALMRTAERAASVDDVAGAGRQLATARLHRSLLQ